MENNDDSMSKKDRMPKWGTPEFDQIANRAMKLSASEICDLLELVGIRFMSRDPEKRYAPKDELENLPKDMLLGPLDEADSRSKVETFLRERGV